MNKPVLLINQSIGPLFEDIIKTAKEYEKVVVFEGIKYIRKNHFNRFLTWVIYSFQISLHLVCNRKKYKKILLVSNPPFAPILGILSKCKYSLLLYDLYPEVLNQINGYDFFLKPVIFIWNFINKIVFNSADHIFTLSNNMKKELKKSFPSSYEWERKVTVIPPWTNTELIKPIPNSLNSFRNDYGIREECLLITYSGNFGITHPLEIVIEASKYINKNIQILMIGSGAKGKKLKKLAKKLNISSTSLRFIDPLPFSELAKITSASDLSIVTIDGPSAMASLPSKTFTSLASGTPLVALAPSKSDLSRLVKFHECGYTVEINKRSAIAFSRILNSISDNLSSLIKLSNNALIASSIYTQENANKLVKVWLDIDNS